MGAKHTASIIQLINEKNADSHKDHIVTSTTNFLKEGLEMFFKYYFDAQEIVNFIIINEL